MDLEREEQFKDLTLSAKPSDYWHRQCKATYQSDRIGIRLLDAIGVDTIMWGSDFPRPDGVWPDSMAFIDGAPGGARPAPDRPWERGPAVRLRDRLNGARPVIEKISLPGTVWTALYAEFPSAAPRRLRRPQWVLAQSIQMGVVGSWSRRLVSISSPQETQ